MKKAKSIRTKVLLFVLSTVILINFIPIYVSADTTDPFAHILGEVYIQNVATGMYMDLEYGEIYGDVSTETGAYAVQRKYSNSDSQKWIIERVQEPSPYAGEIVIRSVYSGKYLGVSYDDTVFLAQYDTIDDFNIWQINYTGDGTYTFSFSFIPTIPDCYTVAVRSPNSSENARIYQMVEEDMASDECDEWYIVKKVISVKNYYDNTFAEDSTLVSYIDDAVSFANKVYSANFSIGVYMDGDATYDNNAVADTCNYSSNSPCSCSLIHDQHHKGLTAMSEYLIEKERPANHIYVMWANRPPNEQNPNGVYCRTNPKTNIHEFVNAFGAVTNKRPVINILWIYEGNSINLSERNRTKKSCMSLTLSHEITHCLGANEIDDVYHSGFSYNCIMDTMSLSSSEINGLYDDCLNNEANAFGTLCFQTVRQFANQYINEERQIQATVNGVYLGES